MFHGGHEMEHISEKRLIHIRRPLFKLTQFLTVKY